jgi:hypothetical protein
LNYNCSELFVDCCCSITCVGGYRYWILPAKYFHQNSGFVNWFDVKPTKQRHVPKRSYDMKNSKKTRKQHNCGECNVVYDKKAGADWIGCSLCDGCFHVECTNLKNDVFIQMAGSDVSIWLCKEYLLNLVMYLPVSSSKVKRRHGANGKNCFITHYVY